MYLHLLILIRRFWVPALLLAAIAGLWWLIASQPEVLLGPASQDNLQSAASETTDQQRTVREQVYFGRSNSIAVLAIDPGEAELEQPWLPDALGRDLVRRLQGSARLRVISPNSSFFLSSLESSDRITAERLVVRNLLKMKLREDEGQWVLDVDLLDVRREESRVQLQLEVQIDSLCKLSDQLAGEVAVAMNARHEDQSESCPQNPESWNLYLQALSLSASTEPQQRMASLPLFRQASEMSPGLPPAMLGEAAFLLAVEDGATDAKLLLEQVLEQDRRNGTAWALMAYMQLNNHWDWDGAVESSKKAVRFREGDSFVLQVASLAHRAKGSYSRAVTLRRDAMEKDPLNLLLRLGLGQMQEAAGEWDEALSTYRQVLNLNPAVPGAHAFRARIKLLQENPESALREANEESDAFWTHYAKALAYHSLENPEEAIANLQQAEAEGGDTAAFQLAEINAWMGNAEASFSWLERAVSNKDPGLQRVLGNHFLDPVKQDERWPAFLLRLGLEAEPIPAPTGVLDSAEDTN